MFSYQSYAMFLDDEYRASTMTRNVRSGVPSSRAKEDAITTLKRSLGSKVS